MISYDEQNPPPAFVKRWGNARVPGSADIRAWAQGKLSAHPRDRGLAVDGKRVADPAPFVARDEHPVTHKWAAPWKKRPTGEGLRANLRTRFKAGDPRTIRAASRSTPAKREAARRNGRLGGRPKKKTPGLD